MDRRLSGSFTIEATYVMAIVFICIVSAINFVYWQRDKVLSGFVTHEAGEEASHIEEIFNYNQDGIESVTTYATERLKGIGRLADSVINIDRRSSDIYINMSSSLGKINLTTSIFNPEEWMRKESVVRDFLVEIKSEDKKEDDRDINENDD